MFRLSKKQRVLLYLVVFLAYGAYLSFFPQKTTPNQQNDSETVITSSQDSPQDKPQNPAASAQQAYQDIYYVQRIVDGDTIQASEIDNEKKPTGILRTVRYIGIDTPETVAPGKSVQCYGKEASARNAELALNKYLRLEKDKSDTDRYGRLLRYAYLQSDQADGDEIFINKALLSEGYAYAHAYSPDISRKDEFKAAEIEAKTENVGLWDACAR